MQSQGSFSVGSGSGWPAVGLPGTNNLQMYVKDSLKSLIPKNWLAWLMQIGRKRRRLSSEKWLVSKYVSGSYCCSFSYKRPLLISNFLRANVNFLAATVAFCLFPYQFMFDTYNNCICRRQSNQLFRTPVLILGLTVYPSILNDFVRHPAELFQDK